MEEKKCYSLFWDIFVDMMTRYFKKTYKASNGLENSLFSFFGQIS